MTNQAEMVQRFVRAALDGDLETVRLSMERDNVNVNAVNQFRNTALNHASYRGHKDIVELLLENDANINAVNEDGCTALMEASSDGHMDIVQLLLDKNTDPNITDKYGDTASNYAKIHGYPEIAVFLLDYEIAKLEDKLDRGGSPQDMRTMSKHLLKKKKNSRK